MGVWWEGECLPMTRQGVQSSICWRSWSSILLSGGGCSRGMSRGGWAAAVVEEAVWDIGVRFYVASGLVGWKVWVDEEVFVFSEFWRIGTLGVWCGGGVESG